MTLLTTFSRHGNVGPPLRMELAAGYLTFRIGINKASEAVADESGASLDYHRWHSPHYFHRRRSKADRRILRRHAWPSSRQENSEFRRAIYSPLLFWRPPRFSGLHDHVLRP